MLSFSSVWTLLTEINKLLFFALSVLMFSLTKIEEEEEVTLFVN